MHELPSRLPRDPVDTSAAHDVERARRPTARRDVVQLEGLELGLCMPRQLLVGLLYPDVPVQHTTPPPEFAIAATSRTSSSQTPGSRGSNRWTNSTRLELRL